MSYETHPLAELIPAMSDQEFAELRDDIAENGLHEPVWLFEGKVLDGRHRARACTELGIKPPTREYEGVEAARFVLSMNVHRRHLTTTQKALIAKAAMPHFKEAAKERQREHAGTAPGQPSNTSGIPARSVSASGNLARDEAAKEVGVSGRTVAQLERVEREDPELYEKVVSGEVSVSAADEEIRHRPGAAPKRKGQHANWDRSTKRFQEIAAKTVTRAWNGLHSLAVVCPALAEMDAALIAETVTPKDREQMIEEASQAAAHLRRFVAHLKENA